MQHQRMKQQQQQQQALMQQAALLQQQSMYHPGLLAAPQIEPIPSGNLPPGFDPSTCRSVYVGNIHTQVTEPLIQEVFSSTGPVEGCKLIRKEKSSYGFIHYFDRRSAALAILSLNGRHLFGQPIKVNWAYASGQREDTSSHYNIFVGDLSPEVTDAMLFACFSVYPSCSDARVMWDQKTGRSRGFGFVSFRNQQDAQSAINDLTGKWLGSRQIRCNWATKGAGTNDDNKSSDAKSVVELTNGSSEDGKETANNDGPENNPQYTTVYVGNLAPEEAAHSSALAEAKKREENLKKALGIEKECVANIEKALHEMRAECAEAKVAAESKLSEARSMAEDAQKKFSEAETKMHAAESLEAETNRYHRAAERKLHEVEAREDDLRRRIISCKSDCDAKEKEILLERESLRERLKTLQQSQERLLDGQALLNQREDYISNRSQDLNRLEKEFESSKADIEKELRALNEERSNLELNVASLSAREEAVIKRECELNRREEELLVVQEKLARKESDGIQQVTANHEAALRARKSEFEAELEIKCKLVEEEIETKRRAWELREVDLRQREDIILEKEHDLEVQSRVLADKEKDLIERVNLLDEKERNLLATEREVESMKTLLHREKEETNNLKLEVQKSMDLLDNRKKQVDRAEGEMEAMKSETNELLVLEMRLKEEIDTIRAQKLEVDVQADELKAEKAKFETEWELIDEKREELRKEAERITEERLVISKFLKDERDCLKLEKDAMLNQYKHDADLLSRDREAFMSEIEHERSEWFSKIQKERADFLLDIEMQKRELENCFNKRREEIESYLGEKEKAFEEEKKKELQHIASLQETVGKEMEQINLEMQKLDAERREINLDRERRDEEWAELNNTIEELKVQRQKLEKQRELLHVDREEILAQIEQMKKMEDVKVTPVCVTASEIQESNLQSNRKKNSARRFLKQQTAVQDAKLDSENKIDGIGFDLSSKKETDISSPPVSAPISWLKRCADTLLERTQSNKKRKQQNDVDVTPSEETSNLRVLSAQPNAPEDEHALMSVNQTLGVAEETTVYIDKIITIREVTAVDGGRVIEDSQYQNEVISKDSEDKLEDHCNSKSDENGKAKQTVGKKTRSKQQL